MSVTKEAEFFIERALGKAHYEEPPSFQIFDSSKVKVLRCDQSIKSTIVDSIGVKQFVKRVVIAFRLKAAIRSRTYQIARMAVSPPQAPGRSGSCFQFVLDTVSPDLVKLSVQCRDPLGSRMVLPKLGRCQRRFET